MKILQRFSLLICLSITANLASAQGTRLYTEAPNPVAADMQQWKSLSNPLISWGSTNVRYAKEKPAKLRRCTTDIRLTAWKGERVSAQWILSTPTPIENLEVRMASTQAKGKALPQSSVKTGFTRYVITDELNKDGQGGCGYRNSADFDSTLVADVIDHITPSLTIPACTSQGGWVSIDVPRDIKSGTYHTALNVCDGDQVLQTLSLTINVVDRTLPEPSDWKFHLDLWQNPYAVARYYNVEPFSQVHFDYMRPIMKHYANAGGKVITASIMHKPWNGQTYDPFESMVTWLKKADGTWSFDFTVFDQWVEFMQSLGVTKQISCYSMVPWRLSFQYFDQASNSLKFIDAAPGEQAYEDLWLPMLISFAKHLKAKGWFEKTFIAMDERPMDHMLATLKVIRKADPDFKVSLAGVHHSKLQEDISDYCLSIGDEFPADEFSNRKASGKITTFYTCCTEARPNTFTFSLPAEGEWLGWFAAKKNLDGYLRWALNSWVKDPLLDSRFTAWAAGDTYLLYPDGRSSIRFERLREGIQQFEKIRLLRQEFEQNNRHSDLRTISHILSTFNKDTLLEKPAAEVVDKAKARLNRL